MENTIENKEKLYALYWGQKVIKYSELESLFLSPGIVLKFESPSGDIEAIPNSWIELKPITSITDEDAIGLAEITFPNSKHHSVTWGFRILAGMGFIDKFNDGIDIKFKSMPNVSSVDYLRSKGYALPWMGLSVEKQIEYGWVKLG